VLTQEAMPPGGFVPLAASIKQMSKIHLLLLFLVLSSSCDSPNEGFQSQIIRKDSLLLVKTPEGTDTISVNRINKWSFLMSATDRRTLRNGGEFRAKMFFWNATLYPPDQLGKSVHYRMYFKNAHVQDESVAFTEIPTQNDTAYVHFSVDGAGSKNDTIRKRWTGKIIFDLAGRDSSFYVSDDYIIVR
jgi:hypothetical protein